MNFVKSIETKKISIDKIGIFKALLIIIVSSVVESSKFPLYLITDKLGDNAIYGKFILDVIFKYLSIIVILKLFSKKNEYENKSFIYEKIGRIYFAFVFAAVMGYRIFYSCSIEILMKDVKINPVVQKAFDELAISPIVLILSVAIIAPIFEEVLFRGIILNGMNKFLNSKIAVVISALLFALMHMNLVQGVNTFFLGIILGFIYIKTKSIYLSIFGHFINNTIGLIVPEIIVKLGLKSNIIFEITIASFGLVIMALGCYFINKKKKII